MSRNISHLAGSGVVSNRGHTIDLPRRGRALRFLSAFALVLAVLPSVSAGVFPGQDWQTASPDSQAVNAETLKQTMDYIQANAGGPGAAECVMGGGVLPLRGVFRTEAHLGRWRGVSVHRHHARLLLRDGVLEAEARP